MLPIFDGSLRFLTLIYIDLTLIYSELPSIQTIFFKKKRFNTNIIKTKLQKSTQ